MIVLEHVWDFISGKATGPRVIAGVQARALDLSAYFPFPALQFGSHD